MNRSAGRLPALMRDGAGDGPGLAERVFASIVGRERVIAGADCGFAAFAGSTEIHPTVAWAKRQALADGGHLATGRL
jgi:5-methyltetrahydropteroyltriglutamate--homocysteine methyltransferase